MRLKEQKEKITSDNIIRGYSVIYDNGDDSRIMCAYSDTKFLYFDKFNSNHITKNVVVDFHEDINEIMNLIINKNYCGYMVTQEIKDLFNSGKLYSIHLEINLTKKEIYLL